MPFEVMPGADGTVELVYRHPAQEASLLTTVAFLMLLSYAIHCFSASEKETRAQTQVQYDAMTVECLEGD